MDVVGGVAVAAAVCSDMLAAVASSAVDSYHGTSVAVAVSSYPGVWDPAAAGAAFRDVAACPGGASSQMAAGQRQDLQVQACAFSAVETDGFHSRTCRDAWHQDRPFCAASADPSCHHAFHQGPLDQRRLLEEDPFDAAACHVERGGRADPRHYCCYLEKPGVLKTGQTGYSAVGSIAGGLMESDLELKENEVLSAWA